MVKGLDPQKLTRLHTIELRGNKLTTTAGFNIPTLKNLFLVSFCQNSNSLQNIIGYMFFIIIWILRYSNVLKNEWFKEYWTQSYKDELIYDVSGSLTTSEIVWTCEGTESGMNRFTKIVCHNVLIATTVSHNVLQVSLPLSPLSFFLFV